MPSTAVNVDDPESDTAVADETPKAKRGSQTSKVLLQCKNTIDELKQELQQQGERRYEIQKQTLELQRQFMEKILSNQEAARQQREDKNNILKEMFSEFQKM